MRPLPGAIPVDFGAAVLFVSTVAGFSGCSPAQIAQSSIEIISPPAITICDLLRNPETYRGKMVAVRGIYWNGLRQACAEPFVTGNHKWASAINLLALEDAVRVGQTVRFSVDSRGWRELEEIAIREARLGRREEIWATITGKLIAPESYIRKGQVVGGYGHLGVFPAELIVARVSDVKIEKNPTYDYGELLHPRAE